MLRRLLASTLPALVVALAGSAAPAAAFAPPQGTDVSDFKRQFPRLESTAERVEAIYALEGLGGMEVADALLPVLKDEETDVRKAALKVLAKNDDAAVIEYLTSSLRKRDKALVAAACQILGEGRRSSARAEIERAIDKGDWTIKYRGAEALGSFAEAASIPTLLPLLKDSEPLVRIATADALRRIPDESAAAGPELVRLLDDKDWRVRAAVIAALARVRTKDALEPLVKIVESDEGRLVQDAAQTLTALVGRDFGRDAEIWRRWFEAYARDPGYRLPTLAELAKAEAAREAAPKGGTGVYKERKITEFLGVQTPSKRVMFIIDTSGSMEDLILERERYRDRNYPGFSKMDIVKEELARTIEALDSKTEFSIVTFATKVKPWKRGNLVPANPVNRNTAIDYARALQPLGGHSREELASAGLSGAAALGEGRTNTYGALMYGLGEPERGVLTKNDAPAVDTVFFLSDGKPSVGDLVDTDDILQAVREANGSRKITIHVLAIGEFEKGFMKNLAEQNGGVFVDLGK